MKGYFVHLALIFGFFHFSLLAQNIDSLKQKLENRDLTSQERSIILENLAKQYSRIHADSTLHYVEEALALATKNEDKVAEAQALITKASIILLHKKDMQNSWPLLDEVYGIIQGDSINLRYLYPSYYLNLGSVQLRAQQFDRALTSFLKGLSYLDEEEEPSMALKFFNNMAIIHMQLKQPQQAAPYLEKAVMLHQKQDLLRVSLLSNLGSM